MKARKYGKIINVSSMGAITPPSPVIHYHAAKAEVLGLTNNLAAELSPFNINVNAILPTAMRTEFFKDVVTKFPDQEAFFDSIAAHSFLKRMCSPEDIAGAALFFASELSAYITGESINVSGGSHLGRH
jgi:3-oxoacyl-[acyl-carrier protein] reductase